MNNIKMAEKLLEEGEIIPTNDMVFLNHIMLTNPPLTEDEIVRLKTIYERNFGYGIDDGDDGRDEE